MESGPERIITDLLTSMGFGDASLERLEVAGQVVYSIKNVPDTRRIIGPHGDGIHAIDYLVKKMYEKQHGSEAAEHADEPLFLVDVDDYRARQIRDLETKAKMMAERARSFQYDVELSPMSAYERLIVHTALQNEPHVKTESQGEGRGRRVVIKYVASE